MSHWASVQTTFRDLKILEKSAIELGCTVKHNTVARGYGENRINALMVICPPGSPYDIAVNKDANGNLTMTTDWWYGHVEKAVGADFGLLKQRYAVNVAKRQALFIGADVMEEKMGDGSIRLKVRRML